MHSDLRKFIIVFVITMEKYFLRIPSIVYLYTANIPHLRLGGSGFSAMCSRHWRIWTLNSFKLYKVFRRGPFKNFIISSKNHNLWYLKDWQYGLQQICAPFACSARMHGKTAKWRFTQLAADCHLHACTKKQLNEMAADCHLHACIEKQLNEDIPNWLRTAICTHARKNS